MYDFFVRSIVNNTEISNIIENFSFDMSVSLDSEVAITVNADNSLVDSDLFNRGNTVSFWFGEIQGARSGRHTTTIANTTITFAEKTTIEIVGRDSGLRLKGNGSGSQTYQKRTASDIARIIALRNHLQTDIQNTQKVYEHITQNNQSDFDFLKFLARLEASPNQFDFWVEGTKLFFKPIEYSQSPVKRYRYNESIISFSPVIKETNQILNRASNEVQTSAFNPRTKNQKTETAGSQKLKDVYLGKKVVNANYTVAQQLKLKTYDESELKQRLLWESKNASRKIIEAELVVQLDAAIETNKTITIAGVGAKFSGNYFIDRIRHDVPGSGTATTTLSLFKNATNVETGDSELQIQRGQNVDVNDQFSENDDLIYPNDT